MSGLHRSTRWDRILGPVHRWVWSDPDRRIRKLLLFGKVETDGGRDILRAAEITPDPLLRRLYLEHAIDELRHGDLFRRRGAALLRARRTRRTLLFDGNPLPGGHGLDDLRIDGEPDHRLLAFLHVAEKSAAGRFTIYREMVDDDPETRASPGGYRRHVWHARAKRLWNRYLRIAAVIAGLLGGAVLSAIYFVVLPP